MKIEPRNKSVELSLQKPGKYEVNPEQTFDIIINVVNHNGRWIVVHQPTRNSEEHRVSFRIWTFEEMIEIKRKSTNIDPMSRKTNIDLDMMNRMKVQKLLTEWTFSKDNPRLSIQHVNGILTDESWKAFTRLDPTIIQKILDEMNFFLDCGG
ncbi:MAG: hypothetical protein M0P12_00750 [Paludibacteraceae bacterium]|nr:hypothetical protein [Paludibacteraceae bacterium]MCK9616099.1 hypothetical protein [Candidatus Omnitrophota bacterium]